MKRSRTLSIAAALVLAACAASAEPPAPPIPLASAFAPPISGVVRSVQTPVAGALVVLYNVAETSLARMRTASDGTFVLASAPVGVYDLIAYKKGYQPALVRILHQAATRDVSSVQIQLASKTAAVSDAPAKSTIWELADRLPADVLRELDMDAPDGSHAPDRFASAHPVGGQVSTVAGSANGDASVVHTTAALSGGLPNGWLYNVNGDYNAIGTDPSSSTTSGNSAGLALAVAPSTDERVQLMARRNSVNFGDDPASLQTNMVSWSRGNETGTVQSVAARYIEETNLYRASAPGTTFFPVASRTWEVQANYARPVSDTPGVAVGMTYRHIESGVGPSGVGSQGAFIASSPDADLAASGAVRLSSRAQIDSGVVGRYVAGGYGIAPRVVARYDVGGKTYLFVSGLYRVVESGIGSVTAMPRIASIEDDLSAASRQAYAVGLEHASSEGASFRVAASEERVGEAVRAFFEGDFLSNLDSVYLLDGNTVRQYQASAHRKISPSLAATVSARYGQIDGAVAPGTSATYGVTDSHGHFWAARAEVELLPTHTGVAVLFHGVRQSLTTSATIVPNDSDKVALSVAQDLSVLGLTPFGSGCKLLVAVESNRANLTGDSEETPKNNRFMGGVALSF